MVRQTGGGAHSSKKSLTTKKSDKSIVPVPTIVGWSVEKSEDDDDDIVSWMHLRSLPDQKRVVWEDSAGSFFYRVHPQTKCASIPNAKAFERESLHERFFKNRQFPQLDASADGGKTHDAPGRKCQSASQVGGGAEEGELVRSRSFLGSRGSEGSSSRVKKLIGLAKKYNARSTSDRHLDQEEDCQDDGYGSKISSTEADGSRGMAEGEETAEDVEKAPTVTTTTARIPSLDFTSRDGESLIGNFADDNYADEEFEDDDPERRTVNGDAASSSLDSRLLEGRVPEGSGRGLGQAAGLLGDRDRVVKFTYSRRSHISQGDGVFPFGRPVVSRGRSNPFATLHSPATHPAMAGYQLHAAKPGHPGYTGQPSFVTSLPTMHGYVGHHFRDSANMNNIRYSLDPSKYQVVSCPSPDPDSPKPITLLLKKVTVHNREPSGDKDGDKPSDQQVGANKVKGSEDGPGGNGEGTEGSGEDEGKKKEEYGEQSDGLPEMEETAKDVDHPSKRKLTMHSATPSLNVERGNDLRAVSIPSTRVPPVTRIPTPKSREGIMPPIHSSQSAPNMRSESRDAIDSDRSSTACFPLGELLPAVERSIRRNRKSKLSKPLTGESQAMQAGRRDRQPTCYISMDTEENRVLVVPAGLEQPNGPPSFRQQFRRSPLQRAKELSDKRMHGQLVTQPVKRQQTMMDGSQTVTIVSPRIATYSGKPRLPSPVSKAPSRQRSLTYEMAPSFKRKSSFARDDTLPKLRF